MSEHSSKPSAAEDEIDLSVVFIAFRNFFLNIVKGILKIFSFFYRHKFVILGLIIFGIVLGYFYEKNSDKSYTSVLLVKPNYGSADYLYTKIQSLDLKINQDDSLFLEDIFGTHYKLVKSIEITPVVDIYNFVSKNESNQELFEILFEEEGSIDFIENPINSRSFSYHHINLIVKGENYHRDISAALVNFINSNDFYEEIKILSLENTKFQLEQNKSIIRQIDSIINYTKKDKSLVLGSSSLSFSDNSGINDLLGKKKALIDQQKDLQGSLVSQNEIIKIIDSNYKVFDSENFLNKDKKKLFPLFLIIIYSLFFLILYLYIKAKRITS